MVIAALIVAVVELTADDETQPLCIEHGAPYPKAIPSSPRTARPSSA